jgi:hypothetical protein
MSSNFETEYYQEISDYIESQKITYPIGETFYTTYNAPNTMSNIDDSTLILMKDMDVYVLKLWILAITLLKRNHDPTIACVIYLKYSEHKDYMCKSYFYKSLKRLIEDGYLIETPKRYHYIINIKHAHKLFKPKFESE